jgi:hypothetical protein
MANYYSKKTVVHLLILLPVLFSPMQLLAEDSLPINAQPASDVLMSYDLWGNPTPVGGVTNGGTTSHSIW